MHNDDARFIGLFTRAHRWIDWLVFSRCIGKHVAVALEILANTRRRYRQNAVLSSDRRLPGSASCPGMYLLQFQAGYRGLILKNGQFEPSSDLEIGAREQVARGFLWAQLTAGPVAFSEPAEAL
jgi:hypothetical protein